MLAAIVGTDWIWLAVVALAAIVGTMLVYRLR